MGTGEFLRMVAPEGLSQCCASPLTGRAGAELSLRKLWVTCRGTGDLICTDWVTSSHHQNWNEPRWAELLFEQMLPLHRLAVIPKRNFMSGVELFRSWCSALCFIPRGENSSGFVLPNVWELPQPGVPVWHREKPEMTIHLLLLPNFTCTRFCGHPKGKIKIIEELKVDFFHQSFHLYLY